jgi:hypothetical protein
MRPHVADAEAYTTEQEAWRTWNDMHLSAEAQVNLPRSRRRRTDRSDLGSTSQ